jgi:malonyl-CoA decarboxylase
MVNYLYNLDSIEANHEAFSNRRPIAASASVAQLMESSVVASRTRSLSGPVGPADAAGPRRSTWRAIVAQPSEMAPQRSRAHVDVRRA